MATDGKAPSYDIHLPLYYGITYHHYDLLLEAQKGACAICGTTDPGRKSGKFVVDHNHLTKKVRGLLCHKCNIMIGWSRDDPTILEKAASYLRNGG